MILNDNLILTIELTDMCNFTCKMCDHANGNSPHKREMGFMDSELFQKIVDDLDKFPVTLITPYWVGESLIHPEFEEMIKYLFEKNRDNCRFQHFNLNTNGALLNEEISDTLLSLSSGEYREDTMVRIHFSVDAIYPTTYKKIKGNSDINKTNDNIKYFLKKYSELKLKFPKFNIAIIVMDENKYEIREFVEYWKRYVDNLGIDIKVTYDWPEGMDNGIYIRRLDSAYKQVEAEALHKRVVKELGLIKEVEEEKRIIKSNAVLKKKGVDHNILRPPCSGPFKTPIIHWSGKVTVCCFDVKMNHIMGDINEENLSEIWYGEKIHKLRMAHIRGDLKEFPACIGCTNLNTPMLSDEEILNYLRKMGEDEEIWKRRKGK